MSSSSERETIEKLLTEVYDWFEEDGWEADEITLKKKLKSLKEAMKELNGRIAESRERPKAITAMLQSLNMSSLFATAMLSVPDSKEIYSEKDVKDLEKLMEETKSWFYTTWKKQNETSPEKNPVLLSKEIYARHGKLDREVAYLLNKAKYHVPKPKPKPAANTTANATADDKKAEKPGDKTNQKADDKKSEDGKDAKSDNKSTDEKSTEKPEPTKETEKDTTKEPVKDEKVETIEKPEVVVDDTKTDDKSSTDKETVEKDENKTEL